MLREEGRFGAERIISMKTWFKFYGLDYLTDSKLMDFNPIERLLWIYVLCLAQSEQKNGIIPRLTEEKLFRYAGIITEIDIAKGRGIIRKLIDNKMIKIVTDSDNDDNKTLVINWKKHQNNNLTGYERVKKHRAKKSNNIKLNEHIDDNTNDNVSDNAIDNAREDKNREEKIRIEKRENSLEYLSQIPEDDLEGFYKKYQCSKTQIRDKGEALLNYCKSHGKKYKDYKAMLENALRKDFSRRPEAVKPEPLEEFVPIPEEKMEEFRRKKRELLGGVGR